MFLFLRIPSSVAAVPFYIPISSTQKLTLYILTNIIDFLIFFMFVICIPQQIVVRTYFWLCTQGSLLAVFGYYMEPNPVQVPCLLYNFSNPIFSVFDQRHLNGYEVVCFTVYLICFVEHFIPLSDHIVHSSFWPYCWPKWDWSSIYNCLPLGG